MAFRSLALPDLVHGSLWLAPMPGRLEPWDEFLQQARRAGLTRIVCLTPIEEVRALSVPYHDALQQGGLPCAWMHLPMRNFGLGEDDQAFRDGIAALAQALGGGESILLHCAAGIGRTGTAAACVLKRLGLGRAQALQRVRDAGSNPETAVQSGLIDTF
jgi:atypical dual specificity phosphatase